MLVWCGEESGGASGAVGMLAYALARERAQVRTPRPFVAVFDEGDSMARLLLSRLYPLHNDSDADQLAAFPDLQTLTPAQLQATRDKLFDTDQQSFNEFRRHLTRLHV